MPDVRTYRADSMQQALDLVRNELGSEAVILNTRQVTKRRFLPWQRPASHVEITASLGVPTRSRAKNARPAAPPRSQQRRNTPPMSPADDGVIFERTSTDDQVAAAAASLRDLIPGRGARPANRNIPATDANPRVAPTDTPPQLTSDVASKLDSIQQMLEQLGRNSNPNRTTEVPAELFQLYTDLIDAEVEDGIARELMSSLKANASPAQLHDTNAALSMLTAMVEREIPCTGPIVATPGQRKVVALVGSTGVGKTTTIAKLAANFRLRDGVKMGLVTVDTYRIAAVEQLRTYAEIIDLPMKVVTSPPEMRRALDELIGLDLILIDTAGRSPRDELQIQELKSLLAEASVDEVHLVMNLTASPKTLEATAQKFAAAGTTSLIMTKLDEAAGMGGLLSVARKVGLPFSYLTTGQDVPDDIEPANSTRISRLILGRERLAE